MGDVKLMDEEVPRNFSRIVGVTRTSALDVVLFEKRDKENVVAPAIVTESRSGVWSLNSSGLPEKVAFCTVPRIG